MRIDKEKLLKRMAERSLTGDSLAQHSGASRRTITNLMSGASVRRSTISQIEKVLGLPDGSLILPDEPKVEKPEVHKEEAAELPEPIEKTLQAIREYGEAEYQRGKEEMCRLFCMAVQEAITRWREDNEEDL